MSDDKSTAPTVTDEPGREEPKPSESAKDATEDETLPSLNPLPSAWLSAGASWFNTAKEKTKNTFDLMKKDLAEFGDAMSQEVSDLTSAAKGGLDTATSVIKEQAQYLEKLVTPDEEEKPVVPETEGNPQAETQTPESSVPRSQSNEASLAAKVEKGAVIGLGWVKSVVDTVTDTVKSLAVEDTTDGEGDITEVIRPRIFRKTILSPEKLLELQSSEATFSKEPENAEGYAKWLARFNLEEYDAESNLLLANNPKLREIYNRMVPSEVESKVFWSRYFFAVQIAEMDEELRQSFALKELTVKTAADAKKNKSGSSAADSKADGESPGSDGSTTVVDQQPTSPAASADDWSVCSEKNYVEVSNWSAEISSTNGDDEQTGPLTPRAKDDADSKRKDDNWVDWEE